MNVLPLRSPVFSARSPSFFCIIPCDMRRSDLLSIFECIMLLMHVKYTLGIRFITS